VVRKVSALSHLLLKEKRLSSHLPRQVGHPGYNGTLRHGLLRKIASLSQVSSFLSRCKKDRQISSCPLVSAIAQMSSSCVLPQNGSFSCCCSHAQCLDVPCAASLGGLPSMPLLPFRITSFGRPILNTSLELAFQSAPISHELPHRTRFKNNLFGYG
jgi:hypothetical protein